MPTDYALMPIYRMIHIDNVAYVLSHGMPTARHPEADPKYINIGNQTLIIDRNDYPINIIPPGGSLGDYVPFYFAGHSPMLLNIKTGWNGVIMRDQSEIVFIMSTIQHIIDCGAEWCFTNGHAKHHISQFYNDLNQMSNLDWITINDRYWSNTPSDLDRQRRKAAEFLVKDIVPKECIKEIFVFDDATKTIVEKMVTFENLNIPVTIDNSKKLYY